MRRLEKGCTSGSSRAAGIAADKPLSTRTGRHVRCSFMTIEIRPFQEADRSVVRQLTIAGFEGVSIDHNIEVTAGAARRP